MIEGDAVRVAAALVAARKVKPWRFKEARYVPDWYSDPDGGGPFWAVRFMSDNPEMVLNGGLSP